MVRLTPQTRQLLEQASKDQRRSMASLMEEAVKVYLTPRYAPVSERLNRFLGSK
jgi:hypothetical protein